MTVDVSITERVRTVVTPILEGHDVALYDVEHGGGRLLIRVETGDLELIERLTRAISRALDEADPIPGGYTLEVSSPGLERPLRTPTHFTRAVGTKIKVRTHGDVEGDRRAEGVLVAADDEGIVIGDRRLRYDEIERARTVFEWGPAPRPKARRTATPTSSEKKATA